MTTSNGSPPAVQPDPEPSASEPMSAQVLRPAGRRRNAEIGSGGGNPLWFTDRSRYEAGFSCPFYRLLRYHAGGTGWQPPGTPEQDVGTELHTILERILNLAKAAGSPLSRTDVEKLLDNLNIMQPSLSATFPGDRALIRSEMTGLAHAWTRAVLPWLMDNFTIASAEQEFDIPIGDDIVWMARPDAVVIHKATGLPCVVEFKSTRAKAERMIPLYLSSLQSTMNAFAVSSHYGQPCGQVQIHMLQLGTKEWPTPITHAYLRVSNPPYVTEDWQPKGRGPNGQWLGKLYRRVPVHEHRTTASWIWSMPESALVETVPLGTENLVSEDSDLVPASVEKIHGLKVIQALSAIRKNENDWRRLLASIDWSTTTFGAIADLVPRSFQCHTYNRFCSFTNVCFNPHNHTRAITEPPDGFERRTPHHPQEKL